MKYARIQAGAVVEIFTIPDNFSIFDCFHPSLIDQMTPCTEDVKTGWVKQEDGSLAAPSETPIGP